MTFLSGRKQGGWFCFCNLCIDLYIDDYTSTCCSQSWLLKSAPSNEKKKKKYRKGGIPLGSWNRYIIGNSTIYTLGPGVRAGTSRLHYVTAPPQFTAAVENIQTNMAMFSLLLKKDNKRRLWGRSCEVHQVPAAINAASACSCDKTLREPKHIWIKPWIIYFVMTAL